MTKARLIAACAALAVTAVACGDDDDAASGDTAPRGDGAGAETEPSTAPSADDPELAADCATLFAFTEDEMQTAEVFALREGDEITDEHREQVDELIGQLEDLDLQSDEGQDARDLLVDLANEVRDTGEVTADLGSEQFAEFEAFATACIPYLADADASGD
jgi:hypothetical protein